MKKDYDKYHLMEWLWSVVAMALYGLIILLASYVIHTIISLTNLYIGIFMIPASIYVSILLLITLTGLLHSLVPSVDEGTYVIGNRTGNVMKWMFHAGIVNFIRIPGLVRVIHANPLLRKTYYHMHGAKIHPSVVISYDAIIADPFMVEIGEGSKLGEWVKIAGHHADNEYFVLNRVKIGKNVMIGADSIVGPGVVIGDNSIIAARSAIIPGTNIPANEFWYGSPARRQKKL